MTWLALAAVLFWLCVPVGAQEPQAAAPPRCSATESHPVKLSLWQRLFGSVSWEEAAIVADSPRAICNLVARHLRYTPDRTEEWLPAREVWSRKRGDCEDFAVTILELCRRKDIPAFIRLYYPGGRLMGHAVVIGKTGTGRLWLSSLGSYREADTEAEINAEVAAELGCRPEDLWIVELQYDDVQQRLAFAREKGYGEVGGSE